MRKLVLTLFTVVYVVIPFGVDAQESATGEGEAATAAGRPNDQAQNEVRLAELSSLYTQQIESYRQAEREFRIAKEQYDRLETLRLLEDAVQATKKAMMERNNVLLTYLDILYLTLQDATGVNLIYKEEALEALETQITALRDYQSALEDTSDREGIAERVTEFSVLQPQIESVAYRALSLISIGKLQTVHDKARLILGDIRESEAEASASALRKAQLDRAFAETERNLESINSQLRTANDDYARQDDLFRRSFYENILQKLEPVYVELSQLISYLQELLTI